MFAQFSKLRKTLTSPVGSVQSNASRCDAKDHAYSVKLNPMRSFWSLLILIIAFHAHCGAQCLGTDILRVSDKVEAGAKAPPCHNESEDSSELPSVPEHGHGGNDSCGQVPAMDSKAPSKVGPALKCVLQSVSTPCVACAIFSTHAAGEPSPHAQARAFITCSEPARTSILRI
jgi:hypothetical protein